MALINVKWGKGPLNGEECAGKMTLYSAEGAVIRELLSAKMDNILSQYENSDEEFITNTASVGALARNISPTRTEEEGNDLNFLYMVVNSIYSLWYTKFSTLSQIKMMDPTNTEILEKTTEKIEYINVTTKELIKTLLEDLKEAMSDRGNKSMATIAYEKAYNTLVKDVLNKHTE